MRRCAVYKAGLVGYGQGLNLQRQAMEYVLNGVFDGIVILQEHLPTITLGKNGGANNLCYDPNTLRAQGVEITITDRGGNITCHNPGQLVVYPIMNLARWKRDLHWYIKTLGEIIVRMLGGFGVRATQTISGIWIGNKNIATIGISAKSWVTSHGFALNIVNDLKMFDAIIPCGIEEMEITSLSKVLGRSISVLDLANKVTVEFGRFFECSVREIKNFE